MFALVLSASLRSFVTFSCPNCDVLAIAADLKETTCFRYENEAADVITCFQVAKSDSRLALRRPHQSKHLLRETDLHIGQYSPALTFRIIFGIILYLDGKGFGERHDELLPRPNFSARIIASSPTTSCSRFTQRLVAKTNCHVWWYTTTASNTRQIFSRGNYFKQTGPKKIPVKAYIIFILLHYHG